jgi:cytochrome c
MEDSHRMNNPTHRSGLGRLICLVVGGIAGFVSNGALAAEPPSPAQIAHGKVLSLFCGACHTYREGEPDKVGPNLHGVIGSRAGTRGDFAYSDALRNSGIVWTDEKLDAWLKQPAALVKDTKMIFAGLPKDQDRADIIVFLKQATQ